MLSLPGRTGRLRTAATGPLFALSLVIGAMLVPSAPAVAMEAHSAEAFRQSFGLNSHVAGQGADDPGRYAQIKDALREIGILYSRGKIAKGNAGRARDLFQCCQIKTLARIDARAGNDPRGVVDPQGIGRALDLAMAIGPEAIVGFEGPNEYTHYQNTGDWNLDLRAYTQRVAEAIRGRGLTQTIVGPTVYMRREAEIRAIGDISAWVDASAFHIYTGGLEPSANLDDYLGDAQIMAPGKPVWVTEYGFHNALGNPGSNPVSELAAAKYLPRFAALLFAASPEGKHFLYEFVDEGTDSSEREQNFGLLRFDLTKKPAYHAIRRLVDAAEGGSAGLQPEPLDLRLDGDGGGVRSVLLQKAAKEYRLLLWQEARIWDRKALTDIAVATRPVTVTLPTAARSIGLIDTLPSTADPARDAPATSLGSNVREVKVDVPGHIVIVDIRL